MEGEAAAQAAQERDFERDRQAQEIGDLVRQLRKAEHELGQCRVERDAAAQEARERDFERDRQAQEIEHLARELRRAKKALDQCRVELKATTLARLKIERMYQKTVMSSSWRLTAPARRAVDMARRLLRLRGG
jgi:seryl-tRNA synthetase